jgi:hypothetical protein
MLDILKGVRGKRVASKPRVVAKSKPRVATREEAVQAAAIG